MLLLRSRPTGRTFSLQGIACPPYGLRGAQAFHSSVWRSLSRVWAWIWRIPQARSWAGMGMALTPPWRLMSKHNRLVWCAPATLSLSGPPKGASHTLAPSIGALS